MENKTQKCELDYAAGGVVPICKWHQVPLMEQSLPGDNPRGLGHLTVHVCPVTQETVKMAAEGI